MPHSLLSENVAGDIVGSGCWAVGGTDRSHLLRPGSPLPLTSPIPNSPRRIQKLLHLIQTTQGFQNTVPAPQSELHIHHSTVPLRRILFHFANISLPVPPPQHHVYYPQEDIVPAFHRTALQCRQSAPNKCPNGPRPHVGVPN